MNFHPPGMDGSTHLATSGEAHTRLNTGEQRRWRPLLQRLSPIPPTTHTRVATAVTDGTTTAIGSTIDYFLTPAPSTVLAHLHITVDRKPFNTHTTTLSDHTPVVTTIRFPRTTRRGLTPIPLWVAKHPIFAAVASARMQDIDPDQPDPLDATRRTVQALHHAAKVTLRRCASRVVTDPVQKLTLAMALTRALTRGNHTAAARILLALPLFRQAVAVHQNGLTQVTDTAPLDRLLADVVRDADAAHKDLNDKTPPEAHKHARATQRQLTRWQALWLPFGRRVVLSKVLPDPTATDDSDRDAPLDTGSHATGHTHTHDRRCANAQRHDRSPATLPSQHDDVHDAHGADAHDDAPAGGHGPPPNDANATRDHAQDRRAGDAASTRTLVEDLPRPLCSASHALTPLPHHLSGLASSEAFRRPPSRGSTTT